MNVLLVDNGTSYLPQLRHLLATEKVTSLPFQKLGQCSFDDYDLIILSGGHKYAIPGHHRKYAYELRQIRATSKPVLGICLGFELIVVSFGGTLKLLRRKVHSEVVVSFEVSDPIASGLEAYKVFESHRRSVKKLPSSLIPLARSETGIEIIKHKERPIYGFQFHPEMSRSGQGRELIGRTIRLLMDDSEPIMKSAAS